VITIVDISYIDESKHEHKLKVNKTKHDSGRDYEHGKLKMDMDRDTNKDRTWGQKCS
jgi:hypothetical protein